LDIKLKNSNENLLERRVLEVLLAKVNSVPGVKVWRMNTGASKIGDRWMRFGKVGQADISGIVKGGRRLEIEVKKLNGKLSEEQIKYGRMIIGLNGAYLLCSGITSIDPIILVVKALADGHYEREWFNFLWES
jgi:hypothetical protein